MASKEGALERGEDEQEPLRIASTSKVSLEQQLYEAESRADRLAESLHSVTTFFTTVASKDSAEGTTDEPLPQTLSALPPPIQALIISLRTSLLRAQNKRFDPDEPHLKQQQRYISQLEADNQRLEELVGTSTTTHLEQQLTTSKARTEDLEDLVQDLKQTVRVLQQDADHFYQACQDEKDAVQRLKDQLSGLHDRPSSSSRINLQAEGGTEGSRGRGYRPRLRSRSRERRRDRRAGQGDPEDQYESSRRSRHGSRRPRSPSPPQERKRSTQVDLSPPSAPRAMMASLSSSSSGDQPVARAEDPEQQGPGSPPPLPQKPVPRKQANGRAGFGLSHAVAALAQAQAQPSSSSSSSAQRRDTERTLPSPEQRLSASDRRTEGIERRERRSEHTRRAPHWERDSDRERERTNRSLRDRGDVPRDGLSIRGAGHKRGSESNGHGIDLSEERSKRSRRG